MISRIIPIKVNVNCRSEAEEGKRWIKHLKWNSQMEICVKMRKKHIKKSTIVTQTWVKFTIICLRFGQRKLKPGFELRHCHRICVI